MKHSRNILPYVSSEGGPIIIGDHEALKIWRGNTHGGSHYKLACDSNEFSNFTKIDFEDRSAILWGTEGIDTTWLVKIPHGLALVRYFADEILADDRLLEIATNDEPATFGAPISIDIPSGVVLIAWAPEDISGLSIPVGDSGIPDGELSMGHTAMYQRVKSGPYIVSRSTFKTSDVEFAVMKIQLVTRMPLLTQ